MPHHNTPRCATCGKCLDKRHARMGCRVRIITCEICGESFSPHNARAGARFCSLQCRRASKNIFFVSDGAVHLIAYTGEEILVDEEDFQMVKRHTWSTTRSSAGKTAYARAKCDSGETVLLHQFLLPSIPVGMERDHINGNGLDNRRKNLRVVTVSQNRHNDGPHGSRRLKGVELAANGRFTARITVSKRRYFLGTFDTDTQAALAYDAFAKVHVGDFCKLNFPDS